MSALAFIFVKITMWDLSDSSKICILLLSIAVLRTLAAVNSSNSSTSLSTVSNASLSNNSLNISSNDNHTHEDSEESTECFDESCGCEYRPSGPLVQCSYLLVSSVNDHIFCCQAHNHN